MDRYSFLNGSRVDGTLVLFGGSAGRAKFFTSLGATDPTALQRLTKQILNGFQILPEFENETTDTKPVAVRYAPMHLYRKKETASIKAFCAMNIAGDENRGDRISTYDHTFVWSVNEMCAGKQFNHVDLLFGTKLTGWQEVMRYRNKEGDFNYDRLPDKVNPEIRRSDIGLCIRCIEAIYAGKNVVIRIEKGHNFNTRSRDILMQIYSLLQPKLAVEVGFASYQDPKKIAALANELSMRIFVLPAGCELNDVPAGFVILDLAENTAGFKLEHSPLVDTLVKWLAYDFEKRLAAYRSIFADVTDYQNADLFVQRSEEFFAAEKALNEWKSTVKRGSVADMDQLREVYRQHIENSIVPWAIDEFTIRIPGMLAAGKTINGLLTDAAVGISSTSGDAQKQESERYLFGKSYGSVEVGKLSQGLLAHQKKVSDAEWAPKVAAAQAETLEAKAEGDRRVAEEQQKAAEELAAANAAAAAALAEEQQRTRVAQQETLDAKTEGDKRVAEEQQKAAAELAAANAAATAALAEEQERTRAAQQATLEAIEEGNKRVAEEQQKAAAELAAAAAAAAAALAEEQERTRTAQQETLDAKADGDKRVAEEQQKAAAELAAAAAAAAAALALEQKNAADALAQEKQKAADALAQEQARNAEDRAKLAEQHAQEIGAEKQRYDELHKKASAAYTSMRTRAEEAEKNLSEEKAKLDAAQQEHEKAIAEHQRAAKAAIAKKQAEITARDNEITRLNGFLTVTPDDVDDLRGQIRTEQELSRNQQREMETLKRKSVIGIIVAFLVGALLCGGIIGIYYLVTNGHREGTGETTVEPTVEPTVETTVPETTDASEATLPPETLPTEPDWSSDAYIEMAKEAVDNLNTVQTQDYTLPEDSALNAYSFVAMLSAEEPSAESEAEEYLLLLESAPTQTEDLPAEGDAQNEETQQDAEALQSEDTKFDIASEEGASMALTWGDQLLVVYGGSEAQLMALQTAAFCVENEPVMLHVKPSGELADISAVMTELQGENWAELLYRVTVDETELADTVEPNGFAYAPAMQISCESGEVYLFAYPEDAAVVEQMKAAASAVLEKEHCLVILISGMVG